MFWCARRQMINEIISLKMLLLVYELRLHIIWMQHMHVILLQTLQHAIWVGGTVEANGSCKVTADNLLLLWREFC